jgi:xanthine dehydrogenase accessory factor
MREVISEMDLWRSQGKQIAVATNVKAGGMSLRPVGAKMAVTPGMEIAGSVTGGCLEGVVYEEAQGVIKSRQPKLLHYGVSGDQKPWEIGLSCGSSLDILVESLDSPAWQEIYPEVQSCIENHRLAAVATVISGPGMGGKLMLRSDGRIWGDLGNPELNHAVQPWMRGQMENHETAWAEFTVDGQAIEVFVDVLVPEERMFIVGASHIAIPLVSMAKVMGFRTIVIDPREAFATPERFPDVDELVTEWPSTVLEKAHLDESCYVVVISHDEKLDNPALAVALKHDVRYVGVLGTRRNIPKRLEVLKEMGVEDEQLGRLHAPIGIRMGAVLPDEIALSILAEMVSVKHGQAQIQQIQPALAFSSASLIPA